MADPAEFVRVGLVTDLVKAWVLEKLTVLRVCPVASSSMGRAHFCRRAEGYVRWAAAWAESVGDERALERVREATGLYGVEAQDWVQLAIGSWVSERGGGTLGGWRPLGVGIWYVGIRIVSPGNVEDELGKFK